MENAIVYDNLRDLVDKIDFALALPDTEIERLREGGYSYYNRNLTPDYVINK